MACLPCWDELGCLFYHYSSLTMAMLWLGHQCMLIVVGLRTSGTLLCTHIYSL